MIPLIGNFSLSLAVLTPMLALMAAMGGGKFNSPAMLRAARGLIMMLFVLLTVSSAALMMALAQSDFRLEYVTHYTERALPIGYKLAAFWAGQEGSLLLWAWLLAGMSVVAVYLNARSEGDSQLQPAAVIGTLAVVCGFFSALMLFAANPFTLSEAVSSDGHGLNPMLQDPGMIAHPPMLFLGYAGFTIPFALLIGALIDGCKDNRWIIATRRWAMVSWLFLSIGILLGAQWAYVELGWGGYWAWDPVENASLLPWLTGTALLHSIMVQQHRGMFKKWNATLIAGTFILCIFGTYLTRSGVIDSVHSFGKSLVGTFFLVFLTISILLSVAIIAARARLLKAEQEMEGLIGREGFFLATNVLLVGMTVITLIGTIFPLISSAVSGEQVTVSASFYNKVVAPLGLLLVALMSVGPALAYGKDAAARFVRGVAGPVLIAVIVVIIAAILGLRNIWALIATAITACALANIVVDLVIATLSQARLHQENPLRALVRLLDGNHRRYGAQIVHTGIIMIVVGITGSSLFSQKDTFALKPGESVPFAGRTLKLVDAKPVAGVNFQALEATLVLTDAANEQISLAPQIRQYDKAEQPNSQVSIRSNWREDVYVTLAASDGRGGVTIQAIVNPLVSWIWTGGVILTIGAIIGLLPRLIPVAVVTVETDTPRHETRKARLGAHA